MLNKLQVSCPLTFDSACSEALKTKHGTSVLRSLLNLESSRMDVFDSLIHPNPDRRVEALKTITESYKPDQVMFLVFSI